LLKNLEFDIPNGVCEARVLRPVRFVGVRNLFFLDILIEEGFIAQKTCDAKSYLASLGMTAKRIFQQPPEPRQRLEETQCERTSRHLSYSYCELQKKRRSDGSHAAKGTTRRNPPLLPGVKLVPFQLVPANPCENTLSVFASGAWNVIWPKQLERH
jgi:hypothetical protein